MKRLTKTKGLYLDSELLWSDAYWELTARELHIYDIFRMKCRIVGKKESKKTKEVPGTIKNNGSITFTYKEAIEIGIGQTTFQRAIDKLVKFGFIDITRAGGRYTPTFYAISNRWLKYGTEQFDKKERKKRVCKSGNFTRF